METLYDMITTSAAQAMGLKDFGLKVGAPANLVVLNAPNVLEALREHAAPRVVISTGKVVDFNEVQSLLEGGERKYEGLNQRSAGQEVRALRYLRTRSYLY